MAAVTSRLWMGFVDVKRSAVKVSTIQGGDGFVALDVVRHLDKAESSGSPCLAIGHEIDTLNRSVACKQRADSFFRGPKTDVTYKDMLCFIRFPSVDLTVANRRSRNRNQHRHNTAPPAVNFYGYRAPFWLRSLIY